MKYYTPVEYIQEVAELFVTKMTEGGLVSDEVLFSSIGEARCREWAVNRCQDDFMKEFIMNDENWKWAVLCARYGRERGLRKYYEEHSDFDQEAVEKLLSHLFAKK